MASIQSSARFGTCTWNYDSWIGLIYTKPSPTAAGYLTEYSQHYSTAEIDSWFYRIPSRNEVLAYKNAVPPDFRFTCKIPQQICLTHHRNQKRNNDLIPNPDFLSLERWNQFLDVISPLKKQVSAFIFEFEYLNKQKMPSLNIFIDKLSDFFRRAPHGTPYAIEPRNSNYLTTEYFKFIQEHNLIHVLSEKQYMPHIYDIYHQFKSYLGNTAVVRLLGGDRKAIETQTAGQWNQIVDPKPDLPQIAHLIAELAETKSVYVNVNNHYEGSAPLTIKFLHSASTIMD